MFGVGVGVGWGRGQGVVVEFAECTLLTVLRCRSTEITLCMIHGLKTQKGVWHGKTTASN